MSIPGKPMWPAYRAPVNPASGLFAVPAAIFVGTPDAALGVDPAAAEAPVDAGFCAALLCALFTMCIVFPVLILYVLKGSSFFMTRPE
jgi:hypothetical protein